MTKFLVSMEASDLPFTLVLNKADLVPEQEVQKRVNQASTKIEHLESKSARIKSARICLQPPQI